MESTSPDAERSDKCAINGDCSPTFNNDSTSLNHSKNIDDISTPSELKFDEGIVNNYYDFEQFPITLLIRRTVNVMTNKLTFLLLPLY